MTIREKIEALADECRALAQENRDTLNMSAFDWREAAKALDEAAKIARRQEPLDSL